MSESEFQPTEKSPEIDKLLTAFTGKDRRHTIQNKQCTTCDNPNTDFRNDLSRKEYTISGMCQNCQDSIFGVD